MYMLRCFTEQIWPVIRSGVSAKKSTPRLGRRRISRGTPEIRDSIASGIPLAIDNSRTASRYSVMPWAAVSSSLWTTVTSQLPVTREVAMRGDRTIALHTVAVGIPVISDRNVEEKSISGDKEVIAALSCFRLQSLRLAYTHQTKASIWPRSFEV